MGTISGSKADKSEAFAWTMGENGAPLIDDAKVSIWCEVDGNYELEHFDHFVCKILATYADEAVLNEKGKIDYHVFKPVKPQARSPVLSSQSAGLLFSARGSVSPRWKMKSSEEHIIATIVSAGVMRFFLF